MSDKKITSLKVDRDTCIGAAPCVATASNVFELDDEQKAVIKLKSGEKTSDRVSKIDLQDETITDETLLAAAQSCPVRAIYLYDEEGNQIFPA
ncbi:ferredoxin [Patescibacteria group bacterium]|nr:ferredoxin [Patescibacteria group bacterium]MBU1028789.1 ferredoxin [Patescibacteria group bacterium]